MGDFKLLGICWKCNTAERKQFRMFLERVEDTCLTQVVIAQPGEMPHWAWCLQTGKDWWVMW